MNTTIHNLILQGTNMRHSSPWRAGRHKTSAMFLEGVNREPDARHRFIHRTRAQAVGRQALPIERDRCLAIVHARHQTLSAQIIEGETAIARASAGAATLRAARGGEPARRHHLQSSFRFFAWTEPWEIRPVFS